jgi:4-amino-4-deoxy-L-arabinose transferase-like glycosyltransferase
LGTRTTFAIGIVVSLTIYLLFFHRLADRDLWSSHEARAGMDAQMILDEGVWGLPRLFDGRAELQKPPLYYWLVASLGWLRGGTVDAWAVRLPATIAALLTVLAIFAGLAWGRRPLAGLLAAIVLATAVHFTWLARIGRIDMPLTLSVTLALGAFYLARGRERRTRLPLLGLAYLAVAAGVLLKGPIGFVLPAVVMIGDWLLVVCTRRYANPKSEIRNPKEIQNQNPKIQNTRGRGFRFGYFDLGFLSDFGFRISDFGLWWGVPLVAVLALPWFVWVNCYTHGEFFRVFLWHHNIERGWGGSHLRANPWWFYLPQFLGDFFPWSLLLPWAIWWAHRRGLWREDADARFGLIWFLAVLLLLSCSRFKRADYLLPAYPGAAVFLGCVAQHWLRSLDEIQRRLALRGIAGLVGVMVAIWLVRVEWWLPRHEPYRDYQGFAARIREMSPRPDEVILFRAEAHPLAFHLGRPLAVVVQWGELNARLLQPGTHYLVTPPLYAKECPLHLHGVRLENVVGNTDLSDRGHEHPLVLLRADR